MKMLSPIGSVMRGSVAGLTFTANQFHQIVVRQRTSPVNPSTTNQSHIRNAFAFAAQRWQNMTQAQRDAWNNYAETLVYEGPLGSYSLPGRQVVSGSFSFLQYINARGLDSITILDDAPTVAGFAKLDLVEAVAPGSPGTGFDLNLGQSMGDYMSVLVQVSLGFNPSRERFKGPFPSDPIYYHDLPSATSYSMPITGLVDGQAYFYRVRGVVNTGAHSMTSETIGRVIATTTV